MALVAQWITCPRAAFLLSNVGVALNLLKSQIYVAASCVESYGGGRALEEKPESLVTAMSELSSAVVLNNSSQFFLLEW